MKKIFYILLAVTAFIFSGCSATDSIYGASKAVYKTGAVIVEVTGVESSTLSGVHNVAKTYDKTRSIVREAQDK